MVNKALVVCTVDFVASLEPTPKSRTHCPVIDGVVREILDGEPNPFSVDNVIESERVLDACYTAAGRNAWVGIEHRSVR